MPGRAKMPVGWEVSPSDDWEYGPLRVPPDVTRVTASMRLAIQAEFGGWELSRVRLYTDGSRRVRGRGSRVVARTPLQCSFLALRGASGRVSPRRRSGAQRDEGVESRLAGRQGPTRDDGVPPPCFLDVGKV